MSKSLGNSLLLEDLLKKYTNEAIKFALLQFNYRADINLTDGIFGEAERHLESFYKIIKTVEEKFGKSAGGVPAIDNEFNSDMSDDFNTALALSRLFGYFKDIARRAESGDKTCADDVAQIKKTYSLLGLFKKDAAKYLAEVAVKNPVEIPGNVRELAEKRWHAKSDRDWAAADKLRAELDALGYTVKDGKDGYTLIRK